MLKRQNIEEELYLAIQDMKIVDVHEHLVCSFIPDENRKKWAKDLAECGIHCEMDLPCFIAGWVQYDNFIASGMPQDILDRILNPSYSSNQSSEKVEQQRWGELKPFMQSVRNTNYYRHLLIALRDLYGMEDDDLNEKNWRSISARIREKSNSYLEWSLKVLDRMNVYKVILDISRKLVGLSHDGIPSSQTVKDPRLEHVMRMDGFIWPNPLEIENFCQGTVEDLDQYLEILDDAFESVVKAKIVGIKSALAYDRTIFYDIVPKNDAERIFIKIFEQRRLESPSPHRQYPTLRPSKVTETEQKVFQDFMMHQVCKRCAEYELPLQIHTGIQARNYNDILNAKPSLLTNLIRRFPDVKFDLFHGGYPYSHELALLAKYFPNVYIDANFVVQISPEIYHKILSEWLDIVPANKILAWGGDCSRIEHSYASLKQAKSVISEVLASKVTSGYFPKKLAFTTANKILYENAVELYRLK